MPDASDARDVVRRLRWLAPLMILAASQPALAELTLPPSGDNPRAETSLKVGLVSLSVDYSSPRVTRGGNDRRGQVFGKLVPFGLTDLGLGCKQCPWRAGANENTVFTTSHAVKVQGKQLPAGKYGLHMIPGPDEWTIIFSNNSTSWGSYTYDAKEDALRVKVKPAKSEYREWLTYEFTEREPTRATLALRWDELQVPITFTIDNANALYVDNIRRELRGTVFAQDDLLAAIDFCLTRKINLVEALAWAERAVNPTLGGSVSFRSLAALSRAHAANGHAAEAAKAFDRAIAHPGAQPGEIHGVGRALLREGKKQEAMKVFEANAKRFPDQWPVHVGLMRGHAALGHRAEAIAEGKLAVKQAPDDANRTSIETAIKTLEAGKDLE